MQNVKTRQIVDRTKVRTLQVLDSDLAKIKSFKLDGESLTLTLNRILSEVGNV